MCFLLLHNARYDLFAINSYASKGITQTAEYGTTDELEAEVKDDNNVAKYYTAGILQCPGKNTLDIEAYQEFSFLSFSTMLAPSQCNFTGFSSLDLSLVDDSIEIELYAYSAGTAEDDIFQTMPKHYLAMTEPISLKTDKPFFSRNQKTIPVGYATITRLPDPEGGA